MLKHLYIKHYALIAELDIDLADGMLALTGETGAGKSIILGALALVMGGKADQKAITEGEEKCVIEATFLDANEEILVRRELNVNGRSRSLVNDEVVSQQELKNLSSRLIDIHSQHQNLLIRDNLYQLGIVDAIAQNYREREAYHQAYSILLDKRKALHDLIQLTEKMKKDEDYLQFQLNQLEEAHLDGESIDDLEQEQYQLSHAEELREKLAEATGRLDDDEQGVIHSLRQIRIGDASAELQERLDSVVIELKDILSEVEHMEDHIEMNPQRLEEVEERLDMINTLLRKHQVNTIDELISLRDHMREQAGHIENADEEIAALRQEVAQHEQLTDQAAQALRQTRMAVREKIERHLEKDLAALNVQHAKIEIEITPLTEFMEEGKDEVEILFAANLNQTPRRIADVASGGEVSRLMLCIKALTAETVGLPTIIFDEIDTGVSGETATEMGRIMQEIGHKRQVITITHLPQIAAKATAQYKVYKEDTDRRTETHITLLNHEERIEQLATMLSGRKPTQAALENAANLLDEQ